MKKSVSILLAAIALLCISSCSTDEETNLSNLEKRLTKGWVLLDKGLSLMPDHTYTFSRSDDEYGYGQTSIAFYIERGMWSLSPDSVLTLTSTDSASKCYKISDYKDEKEPKTDYVKFQRLGSDRQFIVMLNCIYGNAELNVGYPHKYDSETNTIYVLCEDGGTGDDGRVAYIMFYKKETGEMQYFKQHWILAPSREAIYTYPGNADSEVIFHDVRLPGDYNKKRKEDFFDPSCEYTAAQIRETVLTHCKY